MSERVLTMWNEQMRMHRIYLAILANERVDRADVEAIDKEADRLVCELDSRARSQGYRMRTVVTMVNAYRADMEWNAMRLAALEAIDSAMLPPSHS